MGSSDLKLLLIAGLIMKLFVVAAVLLAGVLADPGHHGHHGGKNRGYGYRTRGYGYYGKREADAEAGHHKRRGYYGGYGYGRGYGGYGYRGYYGKRDAEAEAGHHKRRGYYGGYGYRTRGYYGGYGYRSYYAY